MFTESKARLQLRLPKCMQALGEREGFGFHPLRVDRAREREKSFYQKALNILF